MTDVYPIVANRDGIVENVGKFIDESHRIHGPNWPHWAYIQIFGGAEHRRREVGGAAAA